MTRKSFLKKIAGHDPLTIPLCRVGCVYIDGWTIGHVAIYFVFALYGASFLDLFITSILWEYVKYLLKRKQDPHILSDFVANFIGFAIGYWVRQRYVGPSELPGGAIIKIIRRFGLPD